QPGPEARTLSADLSFSPSSFQQGAKYHSGRAGRLACPASQTKIKLGKDLSCLQVTPGHSLHQIDAPTWRSGFVASEPVSGAHGQTKAAFDAACLGMLQDLLQRREVFMPHSARRILHWVFPTTRPHSGRDSALPADQTAVY